MKLKQTNRLFMPVLLSLLMVACKKNEKPFVTDIDTGPYKIENGMVVFKSIPAYRTFMDNLTDKDRHELVSRTQAQSTYRPLSKSAKLIALKASDRLVATGNEEMDETLQDILESELLNGLINADGMVQIGDYLFNIDIATGKCFALHKHWRAGDSASIIYQYFYNGNSQNNYVFEFSTNDEVLDVLESMNYPKDKTDMVVVTDESKLFCFKKGAGAGKDDAIEYFDSPYNFYRVRCKAEYLKLGVYFLLYGKIKMQYNSCADSKIFCPWLEGFWRQNTLMFQWRFEPKCDNERTQKYTEATIGTDNARTLKAWESSRGLKKYEYQIKWRMNGILYEPHFHTTRLYYINDGY